MKIRQGFVSNSSSSSFVLICKRDAFDKFVKNYKVTTGFQEAFIEDVEDEGNQDSQEYFLSFLSNYYQNDEIFDVPVKVRHSLNVQGYEYDEDEFPEIIRDEMWNFENALNKTINKKDIWTNTVG